MKGLQTGSIVAFYHKQNLCIGIVSGCENQAYRTETSDAESILLNANRIVLSSENQYSEGTGSAATYHQALSRFIVEIEQRGRTLEPLSMRDRLLAEQNYITLERAFELAGISDDPGRFAALHLIRKHPELFAFKHNLLRSRNPAETEEYLRKLEEETTAELLRQQMNAYIHAVLAGTSSEDNPEIRRRLRHDLDQALADNRNDSIIFMIRSVDSPLTWTERIMRLRLALGAITSQTDRVVALSGLPVRFSPELEQMRFSLLNTLNQRDLSGRYTFSVDDESTKDIDDAFSWLETDEGYELGIHISDLTALITPGDPIWQEALRRVVSLYLPSEEIPMLPPTLAWQEASLRAGQKRCCLSLILNLDKELQIIGSNIEQDIIHVDHRFTYLEVDNNQMNEPFKQMLRMTAFLRQCRQPDLKGNDNLYYNTVVDNDVIRLKVYDPNSPARSMVAELMVLYNRTLAEYAQSRGIPIIYRNIREVETTDADGSILSASSVYHATTPYRHPGINSSVYAHFTSPIRRCTDMVNQAQICAVIAGKSPYFDGSALDDLIPVIENRMILIRRTIQESQRYWFLRYLQNNHLHHPISLQIIKYKRGVCTAELMPWRRRITIRTENAPPQRQENQIIITRIDPDKRILNGYFL